MGSPKTLEEAMDIFWQIARGIMLEKRRLRGSKNISNQGLYGVLNRVMEDKLARIRRTANDLDLRDRMLQRGIPESVVDQYIPPPDEEEKTGEALEDDLLDSANYFLIAWLLWKGWWELPLISELPAIAEEEGLHYYNCLCPECDEEFCVKSPDPPTEVTCPNCGHTFEEFWVMAATPEEV